jgi:hypothetical protein
LAIFNKSTGHFQPLPANFIPTGNVYVLAHGWAPTFAASVVAVEADGVNPLAWVVSDLSGNTFISPWEALASVIAAKDSNSTILMYSWLDQSATLFPWDSTARAEGMGNLLALTLRYNAGFDPSFYASGGKLHLVGFSHGCEVAAEATADLQAFGTHVDQLTLVDSPEGGWSHGVYSDNMVYVTLNGVQNIGTGAGQTVVDSYLGQQGSFPLPNPGVITHSYGTTNHDIQHLTLLLNQESNISIPWAPMVADGNVTGEYFPIQRTVVPQTLNTQGLVSVNPLNTVLTKSVDTEWDTAITTALQDTSFAFNYQFLTPGDGDQLGVNVDGQLRYLSEGDLAGTDNHTASFDISDLSPGQHNFTFTIYSTGVATSSLSVSNFVVLAMPPPISLVNPVLSASGTFQFGFTNISGSTNVVLVSPSLALPLTDWTALGAATEISSGNFQFTDTQATNNSQRFYRIRSP